MSKPLGLERANGPTFALDDLCFIDFETTAPVDLKKAGAYRYACAADAVILAYAIGARPAATVAVDAFPGSLAWMDLPADLRAHAARVAKGEAKWAAWNAAFDKAVWNYGASNFPELTPVDIIDVMVQGAASGLPADLASAAATVGVAFKDKAGAALIDLFCLPGSTATPRTHPREWESFCAYAAKDVEATRSVFLHTRQLTLAEWNEYWVMEEINERGVHVDLQLVEHAAELAALDQARSRGELELLTGGVVTTVDQVARISKWLLPRLPLEGRNILVTREEEADDDGVVVKPQRFALTRRRVERLIALLQEPQHRDDAALRVLQIRLYGGSKTPHKFGRIRDQHVDGVLFGQYVFNGAGQTGRASSKAVQVHNLARDTLQFERAAIEEVRAGCDYSTLAACNPDPVARQLSLLIRPSFVPYSENVFVWSDWSQIEARVLPWLAGIGSDGALQRLRLFERCDADPQRPDLYTETAAALSHVGVDDVTKAMRQRGKVAELALGFAGGVGALQNMAAAYGLHFSDEEARATVDGWREANQWCVQFWNELEAAVLAAMDYPETEQPAGRVIYVYLPDYLGGTMLCQLPSGRCLTYRDIRYDRTADLDDDDNIVGYSDKLRCSRAHGRSKLWRGMFCENIVQAVAADILRGTLRQLQDIELCVCLHTHDEVLVECPVAEVTVTTSKLRRVMRQGFAWSDGLPLMSEETVGYYYSKHPEAHGL